MILNNKDKQFIDYHTFLEKYDMNSISNLRIKRTVKRSYLISISSLNFLFFLLYLVMFSWEILIIHCVFHFICFSFFNQYNYSIKFSFSNQILEYDLKSKEINLFNQIKEEYYTQHNPTFYYKNEPSFKGNIGSQQLSS
jgi:hypothetical protein